MSRQHGDLELFDYVPISKIMVAMQMLEFQAVMTEIEKCEEKTSAMIAMFLMDYKIPYE